MKLTEEHQSALANFERLRSAGIETLFEQADSRERYRECILYIKSGLDIFAEALKEKDADAVIAALASVAAAATAAAISGMTHVSIAELAMRN